MFVTASLCIISVKIYPIGHITVKYINEHVQTYRLLHGRSQVAQARYMSSSMWTFALLRDSSDLHIYKDLYGERNKPEKKQKITVELQ